MEDSTILNGELRPNGPGGAAYRAAINRGAVNKANVQHSTGPCTDAGKQRSKRNALRHGPTGQTVVLPAEDHSAYQRHPQSFLDGYQPHGATETQPSNRSLTPPGAPTESCLAMGSFFQNHAFGLNARDRDGSIISAPLSATPPSMGLFFQIRSPSSPHGPRCVNSLRPAPPPSRRWVRFFEFPTGPPRMGSFFQMLKSRPSSAAKNAGSRPTLRLVRSCLA